MMYHVRYHSEMLDAMALYSCHNEAEKAERAATLLRNAFLRNGCANEARSVKVFVSKNRLR